MPGGAAGAGGGGGANHEPKSEGTLRSSDGPVIQRFIGNSVFCFFPVFGRFSAKLGPNTTLERRGSSCSAGYTTNQPRRPILRTFCGSSEFGDHPPPMNR